MSVQVIDLSRHNGNADFTALKLLGVSGVILKASQGISGIDPRFSYNLSHARDAGLLCGAYHFGVAGAPEDQAKHFLATIAEANKPSPSLLPLLHVLDFEDNPPHTMSIADAESFTAYIEHATGKPPGIYSGNALREALAGRQSAILSRCWLWVPRYGSNPPIVSPGWSRWDLWQYSEKGKIPGVDGPCDVSKYNGSAQELRDFWAQHAA